MGRQSRLREKKRALRHAVATENITVDEANEYYRREKGRVPQWPGWGRHHMHALVTAAGSEDQ